MTTDEFIRWTLYWGLSIYVWVGVFWGSDFIKDVHKAKGDEWDYKDNILAVITVFAWPWMLFGWKKFKKKYEEEHKDGSEDR